MKRTTDQTALSATHVEASPREIDRGIDVRGVAYTVIVIVALVVAAALGMWWLLSSFLSGAEAADPRPTPAAAAVPRELPPGPRLQAFPEADLARMRAREDLVLSSYGWTAEGGVRIPIDRAIDVLAARGGAPAAGDAPGEAGAAGGVAPPPGDGLGDRPPEGAGGDTPAAAQADGDGDEGE